MIVTFYSYKGGVGRSMALVNVGELIARQGRSVILVDWDLEAPGLERYFPVRREDVEERPGVVDLLVDYRQAMAQPAAMEPEDSKTAESPKPGLRGEHIGKKLGFASPREYLVDLGSSVGIPSGHLRLLPSGRRDGERFASYAANVQNFDWAGFYRDWEGEAYLEWFRRELLADGSLVLIDSRTGVTEIGGVCVYQLADVVVMLCAANHSNLEGTQRMAEAFERPVVQQLRGGRPLRILPVPSRVPKVEQVEQINQFLNDFADYDQMGRYYQNLQLDPETAARKLMIPQIPLYSFRERVAVRETGRSLYRNDDLVTVYEAIANEVSRLTQTATESPLAPPPSLQEESNKVLAAVDNFLAEWGSRCRRGRRRSYRLHLAICLSPLLIALIAQCLELSNEILSLPVAWTLVSLVALIPVAYLFFDPIIRGGSAPWKRIEMFLEDLMADRAAFVVQRGAFERRLNPHLYLQGRLERAQHEVNSLQGIVLERPE